MIMMAMLSIASMAQTIRDQGNSTMSSQHLHSLSCILPELHNYSMKYPIQLPSPYPAPTRCPVSKVGTRHAKLSQNT